MDLGHGVARDPVHGVPVEHVLLVDHRLPTIEASYGIHPAAAGLHLFLLQIAGTVGGIAVTAFMRGRTDQRAVAATISLLMILAMIGILTVPSLIVGWAIASGLSTGSALVVALTLVAQRARTPRDAGRLSGMVQGSAI